MKICVLTHTLNPRTGTGEFSTNLINSLKDYRPDLEFSVLTGERHLAPGIFSFLRNIRSIRKEIKNSDILHALDAYPYGVIAAMANIGINKPLVITAIGSGSLRFLKNGIIRPAFLKWAYKKADAITAISGYVAGELRAIGGFGAEVINPGVDQKFWSSKEPTKIDDYIQKTKPYVLTVGEMKKRKGYELSLSIMKEVIKNAPEVKYMIVSNLNKNKKYWEEIRVLIKNLGMEKKVEVVSGLSREELRAVYQGAAAYLLMPQNVDGDVEGFGLSVIEASASGTPVVVGNGSGANDAVSPGKSGFIVDSEREAVRRLLEIIKNEGGIRETLSKGAEDFARSMAWDIQVDKYAKIYDAKLAKRYVPQ